MAFAGGADDSASAEYYSAAATVVRFDPPLPLLHGPVPSPASGDDGPIALAFRDAASWRAAWEVAEASLVSQCEAGARSGCSISASRKCKPRWRKGLFVAAPTDYEERERCEEREMAACLEAAKEACIKFAKGKCIGPFRDARIASDGLLEYTDFDIWATAADKSSSMSVCALNNRQSFSPGVTNSKGSDVLNSLSSKENNSSG